MSSSNNYWVYVSHWPDAQASHGISIYNWSPEEGKLIFNSTDDSVNLSSYLAINHQSSVLYSIDNQHIDSFIIDHSNGTLIPQSRIQVDGMDGCYLSLSNDNRFLLVAYYSSGNIASYSLSKDGSLIQLAAEVKHEGSSINKGRQESAHPHMIVTVPDSDLILVPDLGVDQIKCYQLDKSGIFNVAPIPHAVMTPGYGPRHLAFHPHKPYVYVLAELESRVVGYTLDSSKGLGEQICDLSMLPSDFDQFTKAADIHISADGKYLYASNRGHDSLAIMAINQHDGSLKLIDIVNCGGSWPRAFAIDPSGAYILVANKRSNAISINKVDLMTGRYKEAQNIATEVAPQCIRFIKNA